MQVKNVRSSMVLALALVVWLGVNHGLVRSIEAARQKMTQGKTYLAVLLHQHGTGTGMGIVLARAKSGLETANVHAEAEVARADAEQVREEAMERSEQARETALENAQCARKLALSARQEDKLHLAEARLSLNAGLREKMLAHHRLVMVREALSNVPEELVKAGDELKEIELPQPPSIQ